MKPQFFFLGITLKHFNKTKKSQLFTKTYVHSCEDELSITLEKMNFTKDTRLETNTWRIMPKLRAYIYNRSLTKCNHYILCSKANISILQYGF